MEIEDSFRVDLPVDETWRVLLDIERIAPCLPGAQLQEIAGDEYRGVVKVKVGPITASYKGVAKFEDRNEETHTAVIVGNGRETRGQGNASAKITMTLVPDGAGTSVKVSTELSITGKVAQFGRGVMADVSAKLLAQFVANLERDVLSVPAVDLTQPDEAEPAVSAAPPANQAPAHQAPAHQAPAAQDGALSGPPSSNGALKGDGAVVRRIDQPEAIPVDLLEMGGSPLLQRVLPIVGGAVLALVLFRLIRWFRSAR